MVYNKQMVIDPKYVVDGNNRRTGVILDIETFEQMQEAIEDAALFACMRETDDDVVYDLDEARAVYEELRKTADANKDD